MRQKTRYALYAVTAAASAASVLLGRCAQNVFTSAAAFPFEQAGLGLRALSLSSPAGNGAAVALYVLLSLLPLLPCARRLLRGRGLCPEDALLPAMSAALFFVLYRMVNPQLLSLPVEKALLGGTIWALLLAYALLRLLRRFFSADRTALCGYLAAGMTVLGMIFLYAALGAGVSGFWEELSAMYAGNTGRDAASRSLSTAFLSLRFLADTIPWAMDLWVLRAARRLLERLRSGGYTQEAVEAADALARVCGRALAVCILTAAAFNLLQLPFLSRLAVVQVSVRLPAVSLAFVLTVLLAARLIRENRRLQSDNDLFI